MKAVILAAGKGKRMRHLTVYLPKPMLTVQDKPVLARIVEHLCAAGVSEYCIITGYRAESIEKYFGDGHARNIRIQYRRQPDQDGTGHAAELARGFVRDDPFLLTYADLLIEPENYQTILATFDREKPAGIIGVRESDPNAEAARVVLDQNFDLHQLEQHHAPEAPQAPWHDAGLYVLTPPLFLFTARLQRSAHGEFELSDALLAMAQAGHRIKGFRVHGYWLDVSDPDSLKRAEQWV